MTFHLAAQVAANADAHVGRALHALSRLRGRAEVLEAAIAAGDQRMKLRTLMEMSELLNEIGDLIHGTAA